MTPPAATAILHSMSLPPDASLPPSPLAKRELFAEERRRRHEDQLRTIRLRMAIWHELDHRGIITPVEIGTALGVSVAEAASLLAQHQWCEGNVALLEAAAARLGVQVPDP